MSTITHRTEAAKRAVAEACIVCRAVQNQAGDTARLLKDDRSPVSVADFASQAVVARRLREELGSVTMVAEEDAGALRSAIAQGDEVMAGRVLDAVRIVWPDASIDDVLDAIDEGNDDPVRDGLHGFWTLDPIDGTSGFLRGQQYAVSLAWIEGADPVIGVLGCPNLSMDHGASFDEADPSGTLFVALAGDNAYVGHADSAEGPSHMEKLRFLERDASAPVRLCESVEASHASHDKHKAIVEKMGLPTEHARLDSQAKYAVVARGQADLYLRLPRPPKDPAEGRYVERIWDHAAGALVASEAGYAVTDLNGEALDFSKGAGLEANYGVVVSPASLHGRVLEAIRELGYNDPGKG